MKSSNFGACAVNLDVFIQQLRTERNLRRKVLLITLIRCEDWSLSCLTCDESWEKTASKVKVLGTEVEDRLWVCPPADVSQRLSCFFLPSTFRKDMDSEDSLL